MDRFRLDSFRFGRVTLSLCVVAVRSSLTTALDKYVALGECQYMHRSSCMVLSYLQGVFSREALITMGAGKRLDCQVDSLVSFQVVVSIEALRTLIALEWPVVRSCLLVRVVSLHEVRHLGRVSTVEARHHSRVHTN